MYIVLIAVCDTLYCILYMCIVLHSVYCSTSTRCNKQQSFFVSPAFSRPEKMQHFFWTQDGGGGEGGEGGGGGEVGYEKFRVLWPQLLACGPSGLLDFIFDFDFVFDFVKI